MSLVRSSYVQDPISDLKKKIRHTYDLYKLLNDSQLSEFFNSKSFDALLLKVANDDVVSFKNNNAWLVNHPLKSKIFAELETVWKELKDTYNGAFRYLVFKDFPAEEKILANLLKIKKRLETIEWKIQPTSNQSV